MTHRAFGLYYREMPSVKSSITLILYIFLLLILWLREYKHNENQQILVKYINCWIG